MKIAIIGSGNVGGALAQNWIKSKHTVLICAKYPLSKKNIELAAKIGEDRFTTIKSGVNAADVVLIATPPSAIFDIMKEMGNINGKIIIDATNSFNQKAEPYATVYHALTDKMNAEIVKCFNCTGFENLLNPKYNDEGIDMFMAGDSEKAKNMVSQLALDAGFGSCINFGGTDKVELLEQFALSWINLAIIHGNGRNMALKILKR